jgi:hypothetical protein
VSFLLEEGLDYIQLQDGMKISEMLTIDGELYLINVVISH